MPLLSRLGSSLFSSDRAVNRQGADRYD